MINTSGIPGMANPHLAAALAVAHGHLMGSSLNPSMMPGGKNAGIPGGSLHGMPHPKQAGVVPIRMPHMRPVHFGRQHFGYGGLAGWGPPRPHFDEGGDSGVGGNNDNNNGGTGGDVGGGVSLGGHSDASTGGGDSYGGSGGSDTGSLGGIGLGARAAAGDLGGGADPTGGASLGLASNGASANGGLGSVGGFDSSGGVGGIGGIGSISSPASGGFDSGNIGAGMGNSDASVLGGGSFAPSVAAPSVSADIGSIDPGRLSPIDVSGAQLGIPAGFTSSGLPDATMAKPGFDNFGTSENAMIGSPEQGYTPPGWALGMPAGWGPAGYNQGMISSEMNDFMHNPGDYMGASFPALVGLHPSDPGIAGIMSTLGKESYGFDPSNFLGMKTDAFNPTSGAAGLEQALSPGRVGGLFDALGITNDMSKADVLSKMTPDTLQTQIAYAMNEMATQKGLYGPSLSALTNAGISPAMADNIMTHNFERPGLAAEKQTADQRGVMADAWSGALGNEQNFGNMAQNNALSSGYAGNMPTAVGDMPAINAHEDAALPPGLVTSSGFPMPGSVMVPNPAGEDAAAAAGLTTDPTRVALTKGLDPLANAVPFSPDALHNALQISAMAGNPFGDEGLNGRYNSWAQPMSHSLMGDVGPNQGSFAPTVGDLSNPNATGNAALDIGHSAYSPVGSAVAPGADPGQENADLAGGGWAPAPPDAGLGFSAAALEAARQHQVGDLGPAGMQPDSVMQNAAIGINPTLGAFQPNADAFKNGDLSSLGKYGLSFNDGTESSNVPGAASLPAIDVNGALPAVPNLDDPKLGINQDETTPSPWTKKVANFITGFTPLGIPNTISGIFGGPTVGGLLAKSTPGMPATAAGNLNGAPGGPQFSVPGNGTDSFSTPTPTAAPAATAADSANTVALNAYLQAMANMPGQSLVGDGSGTGPQVPMILPSSGATGGNGSGAGSRSGVKYYNPQHDPLVLAYFAHQQELARQMQQQGLFSQ